MPCQYQFGLKKQEAVRQYREFIEDGFNMGRREDLTGGGLIKRRQKGPSCSKSIRQLESLF